MKELACAQVHFHLNISQNISDKMEAENQSNLTNISLRKVFGAHRLYCRWEFSLPVIEKETKTTTSKTEC